MSQSNKETKSNQIGGLSCPCDASTGELTISSFELRKYMTEPLKIAKEIVLVAVDPRIDEMQDVIVSKDAKLNAMRNTIAVSLFF